MTTPNSLSEQVLAVPDGAGAIRSAGETFQPDPYTGTGRYSIPIPMGTGPAGLTPALSLSYSTHAGSGAAGVGWSLGLASVTRRTDRGLPRYDDSDRFALQGDELVSQGGGHYRHRIETRFARVQHITGDGRDLWMVTERDGTRTLYGESGDARLHDGSGRVAAWYVTRKQDVHGNTVHYGYERDAQTPRGAAGLRHVGRLPPGAARLGATARPHPQCSDRIRDPCRPPRGPDFGSDRAQRRWRAVHPQAHGAGLRRVPVDRSLVAGLGVHHRHRRRRDRAGPARTHLRSRRHGPGQRPVAHGDWRSTRRVVGQWRCDLGPAGGLGPSRCLGDAGDRTLPTRQPGQRSARSAETRASACAHGPVRRRHVPVRHDRRWVRRSGGGRRPTHLPGNPRRRLGEHWTLATSAFVRLARPRRPVERSNG